MSLSGPFLASLVTVWYSGLPGDAVSMVTVWYIVDGSLGFEV